MKDKITKYFSLLSFAALFMGSRYYTIGFGIKGYEKKDFLIYALFFLVYLFTEVFFVNGIICSFICGVGTFLLYHYKTTLLVMPLLLFWLTNSGSKTGKKGAFYRAGHIIQLIYLSLVEPVLIIAYLLFDLRNEVFSLSHQPIVASIICYVIFTGVVLYICRLKNLSSKKQNKNPKSVSAYQFGYLLVSYIESILLTVLSQQPYYWSVLLSDLWLGVVAIMYLRNKNSEKEGAGTISKKVCAD